MKPVKCLFMSTLLLSSSFIFTMENKDLHNIDNNNTENKDSNSDQKQIIEDFIYNVGRGNLEKIKELIGSVKNINAKNKFGHIALTRAICLNDDGLSNTQVEEIILFLMKNGADINSTGKFGMTPFTIACYKNKTEVVKLLLKNKVNLNLKDKNGYTALMWASGDGYIKITKLLIESGADIYIKDNDGNTALSMLKEGDECAKLLRDAHNKNELLIEELTSAILNEDKLTLAKLIIKNPNLTDQEGNNALHIAAKYFKVLAFNIIWKYKPELFNKVNYKNQTATDTYPEIICQLITAEKLSLKNKPEDNNINGKLEEK